MDTDWPMMLAVLAGFVFCIVVHEVAHAIVAHWLGDDTAMRLGRITLNPIPHVDPFMSIVLPAIGLLMGGPVFGGAKPVPVDMRNFRHPLLYMCWTALAGPVSNVLLAFAFGLLINLSAVVGHWSPEHANKLIAFFVTLVQINVLLACFNMIPIPPLDGSRILAALLPPRWGWWIYSYPAQNLGMMVVVVLVVSRATTFILAPVDHVTNFVLQNTVFMLPTQ